MFVWSSSDVRTYIHRIQKHYGLVGCRVVRKKDIDFVQPIMIDAKTNRFISSNLERYYYILLLEASAKRQQIHLGWCAPIGIRAYAHTHTHPPIHEHRQTRARMRTETDIFTRLDKAHNWDIGESMTGSRIGIFIKQITPTVWTLSRFSSWKKPKRFWAAYASETNSLCASWAERAFGPPSMQGTDGCSRPVAGTWRRPTEGSLAAEVSHHKPLQAVSNNWPLNTIIQVI